MKTYCPGCGAGDYQQIVQIVRKPPFDDKHEAMYDHLIECRVCTLRYAVVASKPAQEW